jgi:hypothetical protein
VLLQTIKPVKLPKKNDNALDGLCKIHNENMNVKETGQNFGQAVEAMKLGFCVRRAGWNGKGMWLWINKGSMPFDTLHGDDNLPKGGRTEGIKNELFDSADSGTSVRLPNINMRAATGSTVTGWLASQTDILAEDWDILEPGAVQG